MLQVYDRVVSSGSEVTLPANAPPIAAIITDYGAQRWDRTPARLEVFGVRRDCNEPSVGQRYAQPTFRRSEFVVSPNGRAGRTYGTPI